MALDTERKRIAHLLRRFGLGASEAELDYYTQGGVAGCIQRLLDYESQPEWELDIDVFRNPQNGNLNIRMPMVHWYLRLLATRRPLQEKLTIFWHDHFATSAQKVGRAPAMYDHLDTIRQGASGSFLNLLTAVSKDPAMLFWLDNQTNVAGKPNENFAREVMELFTLGIGHYTEHDIQEAARAFTGWSFRVERAQTDAQPSRNWEFQFFPGRHDAGVKTVLGKTGRLNGDDVLAHLAAQPQTSRYIVEKMWTWFAYPEPEKALMDRLSNRFHASGQNIADIAKAIMESDEFYSDKAERAVIKNPIDFCLVSARQFGLGANVLAATEQAARSNGQPRGLTGLGGLMARSTASQGMELTYPPDVAGWEGGRAWISTAAMVERIKWAETLFINASGRADRAQPLVQVGGLFEGTTPTEAVARLVSLFDIDLDDSKRAQLNEAAVHAAGGGRVTAQSAARVCADVSKLIFGSPEFQFA